jgi:hypothetical protein
VWRVCTGWWPTNWPLSLCNRYAKYFGWKKEPLPPQLAVVKANDWHHLACNLCAAVRQRKADPSAAVHGPVGCDGGECLSADQELSAAAAAPALDAAIVSMKRSMVEGGR